MLKIVFMGTPDFSVPILERLITENYSIVGVVTQPDRPVGRRRTLTPPPVKVAAEQHNLKVIQPEKISEQASIAEILSLGADIIITAAYGQILPKELLTAPRLGCINVHASLLPKLRGGAPIHYAIIEGKKMTGVTIMYMVEKLDAGDILTQVEVPISETDHVGSLHDKLSKAGANLLAETLPKLVDNNIKPQQQNEAEATFAYNIKREQEKIDWSKPGQEVYNHIRGLHPWPVAYTTIQAETLKIWWGKKVSFDNNSALPGTILKIEEDGFIVKTGDNVAIKVTELQPAGRRRMETSQFLLGTHNLSEGTILGEAYEKKAADGP